MSFEVFDPTWHRGRRMSASGPMVGIHATGAFLLNPQAKKALGDPEAAILHYDKANALVGISAAQRGAKNSYTVGGYYPVIGAQRFSAHYGVELKRRAAARIEVVEIDGEEVEMLVFSAVGDGG